MAKKRSRAAPTTQTEKAFAAIKRGIVRGDIAEGTFLSEEEIGSKYGVGRTPFREACNRLVHEGLIESVARRGYRVPELSFHGVRDGFELRLILESAVAQLAAVRATEADIQALEQLARRPGTTLEKLVEANAAFHLRLAQVSRNSEIVRVLSSVLERAERVMYIELRYSRFDAEEFQLLHEPIVEALRQRDPAAARRAVLRDIEQAQSAMLGRAVPGEGLETSLASLVDHAKG